MRGDQPNITWVLSGVEAFGVRRAVLNLLNEMRRRGVHVEFLALRRGAFTDELRSAGVDVEVLGVGPAPAVNRTRLAATLQGLAVLGRALTLAWRMSRSGSFRHASHVQVLWPNLVLATALAARLARVDCVWEMANVIGAGRLRPLVYRTICRLLGVRVIANSRHVAASLTTRARLPYTVPVMHLAADDAFRDLVALEDQPPATAVCIARLNPAKAQDVLIRACADPRLRELRVRIVGSETTPGYAQQLADLVRDLGVQEQVTLVGHSDDPAGELARASIAICLNRAAEPFGLSVAEALMAGRPVLATRLGGPGEMIEDGRTGWLIDAADERLVAEALVHAIAERGQWPKMGAVAREYAIANLSLAAQGDRYLEILAARPPRRRWWPWR